ncbi:unnamed protein product, partial [marine sediment metagenome]
MIMSKRLICLIGILGILTSSLSAVYGVGPVARWEFEGDANDSITGVAGVLQGNAQIITDPERGQVLSLDGDGDYVYVDDNDVLDFAAANFTLSAWVKAPVGESYRTILWKGATAADWYYVLLMTTGIAHNYIDDGSVYKVISTQSSVDDGQWHSLIFVFDTVNGAQCYIDNYPDGDLYDIST